jgi:excisionase family DNA binding protein
MGTSANENVSRVGERCAQPEAEEAPPVEAEAEKWYKRTRRLPGELLSLGDRRWLNTAEVAAWLGLSVRAIQRLTASRRIPFIKVGHRTILFDRAAVDAWMESRPAVAAPDAARNSSSDPRRAELILETIARRRSKRGR